MIVDFKTSKLKKQCENPNIAKKDFGSNIGDRLTQRIRELTSATSLEDIGFIPAARLHRLEGKRQNQYAVDLVHPFRLVFEPVLKDGVEIFELDRIDRVKVEEVSDYHGKKNRK